MFCNVCSKEIYSPKYETVGNQVVCCLSCVGLLVSNEQDKCDQCQRPVWKDNYYIFNSKNYCSEKCKVKAVKRYLKQNTSLTGVNINHVQSEYFKNDSPIKNLQELRKEVKELYKDFEFEENNSNNNQNSLDKNPFPNIKTVESLKKIDEINETSDNDENKSKYNNNINPNSNTNSINTNDNNNTNSINNDFISINNDINNNINYENNNNINLKNEPVKKYNLIPNKIASIKIIDNDNSYDDKYNCPRLLSKKNILKSYRRVRNNYSFDNKDKVLYDNNDMESINNFKYSCNNYNKSIGNINRSLQRNMKLKPTILRYQNKEQKLKNKLLIKIPNPHMNNINDKNNSRFNNSFANNENENCQNIDYSNRNMYKKHYKYFNTVYDNYKSNNNNYQNNNNDLKREKESINRIVYLCDPKYKIIKHSDF